MELGRWFKAWVEQHGNDLTYNQEVKGFLYVERDVDTLTVDYQKFDSNNKCTVHETEYYRVTRIC